MAAYIPIGAHRMTRKQCKFDRRNTAVNLVVLWCLGVVLSSGCAHAPAPSEGEPGVRHRPQVFERLWRVYPNKTDKEAAIEAWNRLQVSDEELKQMRIAYPQWKNSLEWTKDKGAHVPPLSKWLGDRMWELESPPPALPRRFTPPKCLHLWFSRFTWLRDWHTPSQEGWWAFWSTRSIRLLQAKCGVQACMRHGYGMSCSMVKTMDRRLQADPQAERRPALAVTLSFCFLGGCGEPLFENAGSQHTLLEDREACVVEIDQSPGAMAYRKDPSAHVDYPGQVFDEMNRCIERKGWKLVVSQPQQEQLRETIASELPQTTSEATAMTQPDRDSLVEGIRQKFARRSQAPR